MSLRHAAEYAAEIFALISALLLWLPAYRLGRNLLLVRDMETIEKGGSSKLKDLARVLGEGTKVEIQGFNLADYRYILWGFFFAIVSSAMKLGIMVSAPSPV